MAAQEKEPEQRPRHREHEHRERQREAQPRSEGEAVGALVQRRQLPSEHEVGPRAGQRRHAADVGGVGDAEDERLAEAARCPLVLALGVGHARCIRRGGGSCGRACCGARRRLKLRDDRLRDGHHHCGGRRVGHPHAQEGGCAHEASEQPWRARAKKQQHAKRHPPVEADGLES